MRNCWEQTGLPWVPHIPTVMTPFYFAATGLLDGTNLSNGIGTPTPLEGVASSWLDGERLAARLNAAALPTSRSHHTRRCAATCLCAACVS